MKYGHQSAAWALLACAASLILAGCGGGGGGDNTSPAIRFAAEGFWGGPDVNAFPGGLYPPGWNGRTGHFWGDPTSASDHIGMVVLSTGETWGVYSASDVIIGAMHGQTARAQVPGNGVTISGVRFWDIGTPALGQNSVSYTGFVSPLIQIDVQGNDDDIHFVGSYDKTYDRQASLAQLAGSYTGTGGTTLGSNPGTGYSISISSTGAVTLPPDAVGCGASGTATPHTDKNVFDLSLRFWGVNCALGNGAQANGIAVRANDGHLLMMAATPNDQAGFIYVSR